MKRLATRHIVTANLEESHIREVYGLIAEIERQAVESILGTGKEAEANLVAEGGNLAVHTGIAEKTQNTYVQTLLTNASVIMCLMRRSCRRRMVLFLWKKSSGRELFRHREVRC